MDVPRCTRDAVCTFFSSSGFSFRQSSDGSFGLSFKLKSILISRSFIPCRLICCCVLRSATFINPEFVNQNKSQRLSFFYKEFQQKACSFLIMTKIFRIFSSLHILVSAELRNKKRFISHLLGHRFATLRLQLT